MEYVLLQFMFEHKVNLIERTSRKGTKFYPKTVNYIYILHWDYKVYIWQL